jgi:uncharacterized protein (TIGR03435 family)
MRILRFLYVAMIFSTVMLDNDLLAQTTPRPAFEVASIKPTLSLGDQLKGVGYGPIILQGPEVNIDGTRADFKNMSLDYLIKYAYKLKGYQIVGPAWLEANAFEIRAKLPEGGTKEQVREMMQSLLEERFKLAYHHENRERSVYALIVSKDGHKLGEVIPETDTVKAPPGKDVAGRERDKNVARQSKSKVQPSMRMNSNGMTTWNLANTTMTRFAGMLNDYVDRPIVDLTGLNGAFSFSMEIATQDVMDSSKRIQQRLGIQALPNPGNAGIAGSSPGAELSSSDPSGGSIFNAVQKLGLKLDPRKMSIETMIIDKIEKNPTED